MGLYLIIIAECLGISVGECNNRILDISSKLNKLLIKLKVFRYYMLLSLSEQDLFTIKTILIGIIQTKYPKKDKIPNNLLEIVLLYYYILDIVDEDLLITTYENYFEIINLENYIMDNINLFAKYYFSSLQIRTPC